MREVLSIENFVGMEQVTIELNQLNILIGPQATGKSIIAKLLFYFKGFIWELFSAVENEQTKRELDARFVEKFKEYFPPDSWGKKKFLIRYEIQDNFIEIVRNEAKTTNIQLNYSEYFKKELNYCRRMLKKIMVKHSDDERYQRFDAIYAVQDSLIKNVTEEIGERAAYFQLFIPAGRSFFANLQSSIFSFLSSNNAIDPFLKQFGSYYENIKRYFNSTQPRRKKDAELRGNIEQLVESILCGKYVSEKNQDYLALPDGRKIRVANSSSGQQEMLPLAIILSVLPFRRYLSGQTIYIEEPEAHLFPSAQRNIIELIATIFNTSKTTFQFLITTHSPYILTAVNNLLQAGGLSKLSSIESSMLKNIVSPERMLFSQDIVVYSLNDGRCEKITDGETGLIATTIIDSVSDDLAIQFDQLLEIE